MTYMVYSARAVLCRVCGKCQRDCRHNHGPAYTVESLRTGELGTFSAARDVAWYLWGRDISEYCIRRYGVRCRIAAGGVASMRRALEAM